MSLKSELNLAKPKNICDRNTKARDQKNAIHVIEIVAVHIDRPLKLNKSFYGDEVSVHHSNF